MRSAVSVLLFVSACQLPTNLSPTTDNQEVARLRKENKALQETIQKLTSELKAAQAAPALSNKSTAVLVSLPGSFPSSLAASGPASNPSDIEERTMRGRAEQSTLAAQYGEEYVADLYRQALSGAPNDPASLYLAARFSPDPDDQLAYCKRAVELYPGFGFGHHCLSVAHKKKGDGAEALAAAETAQKYSAAVEIAANAKLLHQREMKWFTQSLTTLTGEASATREFSLGNAKTSATLRSLNKGLACSASLRETSPWKDCAGVVCGEAVFAYQFDGPEDPFYSHTQVCGDKLIFTDQTGKTMLSETKLPCSRLDDKKTTTAIFSVCLSSQNEQITQAHLDIPGEQAPLSIKF